MSGQLAFDFDLTEEWVPIYRPHVSDAGLVALVMEERCRDCGRKAGFNQGGAVPGRGTFMVCDNCAVIDGCEKRAALLPDECAPGEHISHWGTRHTVQEHEEGVAERERRRAKYRKAAA